MISSLKEPRNHFREREKERERLVPHFVCNTLCGDDDYNKGIAGVIHKERGERSTQKCNIWL